MSKTKVILIHGKDADPSQKRYPRLKSEVEKRGIKCAAPALPNASDPILAERLDEIEKLNPDENTILIGHSRGGVAILRWLQRQTNDKKVKKTILVAANNPSVNEKNQKENTHGEDEEGEYVTSTTSMEKMKIERLLSTTIITSFKR